MLHSSRISRTDYTSCENGLLLCVASKHFPCGIKTAMRSPLFFAQGLKTREKLRGSPLGGDMRLLFAKYACGSSALNFGLPVATQF